MRHVLFVTGTRAEYDILRSVIAAVDATDGLRASVVVTGAHLAPMYGHTVDLVEADGVTIAGRLETLLNTDSRSGRVKSAATQLSGLVDLFVAQRPDFVVAPMDREEAVTTALAGAYLGIPVVHVGGGDTAEDGNIDNSVRDAVTKLSTCTWSRPRAAPNACGDWVRRRGESTWWARRGSTDWWPSRRSMMRRCGASSATSRAGPSSCSSSIRSSRRSSDRVKSSNWCRALLGIGRPVIVGYPELDAGSQRAIEVIDRYVTEHPEVFHGYRNLGRHVFVNLLRRASVLVGNSSAGIIEAPLLGLPVVNIGPRQVGREHADNVLFVDHEETAVPRQPFDARWTMTCTAHRSPRASACTVTARRAAKSPPSCSTCRSMPVCCGRCPRSDASPDRRRAPR